MKIVLEKCKFIIKIVKYLNLNTLRINFRYFDFFEAIKLPIFLAPNVKILKLSGSVLINKPIYPGMIRIGYGNVGIFDKDYQRTLLYIEGVIEFDEGVKIGHGSRISSAKGSLIRFGKNFTITAHSSIISRFKITFGNDCLLSWDILIMDSDFHFIKNTAGIPINEDKEIIIGDKVWIGCRSIILKGSIIPDNCVIGAQAIVSSRLSEKNVIYAKCPITIVKKDIYWEK